MEKQKEYRMKKCEGSLRELWDKMERNNIHIKGIWGRDRKKKGEELHLKELIAENFPNLEREIAIKIHGPKVPK